MTAAASTAMCVHTRPYYSCHHPDTSSRSTRVQQAVVLKYYLCILKSTAVPMLYGRTAVCISYHGRVYTLYRCTPGYVPHAHA